MIREINIVEQIITLLDNYYELSLKELDKLRILTNMLSSILGEYLYLERINGHLERGEVNKSV